jgi:ribose transport system substrate-binding protein
MMVRPRRLLTGTTAILAVALLAAGCSSAAPPSEDPDADGTGGGSTAFADLQTVLDEAEAPVDEFVAPGPAIDAGGITGGTVHVIVPALEVEDFSVVVKTATAIFDRLGVEVKSCGTYGGSPDGVANCLQQAIDGQAIGIITVGITAQAAPTALAAVADAGIPIVNALTTSSGEGDPALVGYLAPDFAGLHGWLTDWAIVDSGGEAGILALKSTDSDITPAWVEDGVVEAVKACSGCTAEVIDVNVPNADKIPTQVTAELIADPGLGYVLAGTNNFVADAVTGAQAAGRTTADTKVGTVGNALAVMQQLEQEQWIGAVAGFSIPALSWYASDALMRLVLEQPLEGPTDFPYQRLFTHETVGELDLTQGAWEDGSWFGDSDYEAGFLELWGLEG